MKKLLSVFLSIVLVMGFTPVPAIAEPGNDEANGGTTTAGETGQMVTAAAEDSQTESGAQHNANAQADEGDGATRSDMTAQDSGRYEYEGDYSGCYLLYSDYTDDIGSGVVVYEIGMPYTPYRFDHYHPGVDPYLTIPAEIDGKPVVGIGEGVRGPAKPGHRPRSRVMAAVYLRPLYFFEGVVKPKTPER